MVRRRGRVEGLDTVAIASCEQAAMGTATVTRDGFVTTPWHWQQHRLQTLKSGGRAEGAKVRCALSVQTSERCKVCQDRIPRNIRCLALLGPEATACHSGTLHPLVILAPIFLFSPSLHTENDCDQEWSAHEVADPLRSYERLHCHTFEPTRVVLTHMAQRLPGERELVFEIILKVEG